MHVFPRELADGLADALAVATARVQAHVTVRPQPSDEKGAAEYARLVATLKSQAKSDVNLPDYVQPDLAWIQSILASTGWNLNDDVFLAGELWEARGTPCHKPINLGHDEHQIVGHLVESQAVTKDGKATETMPEADFDLLVNGVLYERLLPEAVASILEETEQDKLFVSMECWFDDIAYALREKADGPITLIPRTPETAYLTKHLRAYGGSGKYEGAMVGRVLKQIRFAGKGIVHTPANPDSVIKEVSQPTTAEQKGGVEPMPKTHEEIVAEQAAAITALQSKLTEAESAVAKLAEAQAALTAAETAKATLSTAKAESEAKVQELTAKVSELDAKVVEATKRAEAAETKAAEAQVKLDEIAKTAKANKRLVDLKAVSTVADEAQTLKDIAEMSEEAFAMVLKYAGRSTAAPASPTTTDTAATDHQDADDVLDNAEPKGTAAMNVSTDGISSQAEVALAVAEHLLGGGDDEDDKK